MRFIRALLLVTPIMVARTAIAGGAAGNGFGALVNPPYDFQMAVPLDWACDGCSQSHEGSWSSHPKVATPLTAITVDFELDQSVQTKAGLKAKLGAGWHDVQRGGFVGFTNSTDANPDEDLSAEEYYLVAPAELVHINWKTQANDSVNQQKLMHIKQSIHTASTPPRLDSISTEQNDAYKVGDDACWLVKVADFAGGYSADSLSSFGVLGAPSHWTFLRSVTWDDDSSTFRICITVNSSFPANGLQITSLVIASQDSAGNDREISCTPDSQDPSTLVCSLDNGLGSQTPGIWIETGLPQQRIKPTVAPIDNPNPEATGPTPVAVNFEAGTQTLRLDAASPSGFASAEVILDDGSHIVYPDEIGKPVDLSRDIHPGWNVVRYVVLYSGNRLPTVLRVPPATLGRDAARNDTPIYYQMVTWTGQIVPTDFPVISFFHAPNNVRQSP